MNDLIQEKDVTADFFLKKSSENSEVFTYWLGYIRK